MKTYIAQRCIDHNNQVFEANELIDLDDVAAKPLLAVGAVVEKPVEVAAEAPKVEGGGDDGASETAAAKTATSKTTKAK